MSMRWWNWVRMPPASLIRLGQRHHHALARAAEVRGDLLGPLERRIERPRPRHRHVRRGLRRAPDVVELHLLGDRNIDALNRGHVEGRADRGTLGAGAVVAADVDDDRVVELAEVLDLLDHAADLVVGVRDVRGEHLGLPREQLLLVGLERVPLRQLAPRIQPGRPATA